MKALTKPIPKTPANATKYRTPRMGSFARRSIEDDDFAVKDSSRQNKSAAATPATRPTTAASANTQYEELPRITTAAAGPANKAVSWRRRSGAPNRTNLGESGRRATAPLGLFHLVWSDRRAWLNCILSIGLSHG